MPNHAAKVSSAYVSAELLKNFIAALPACIRELYGNQVLTAHYGWDCNLHADLLYQPMRVPLDVFPYFIEDSLERRIFVLGGSDLLIEPAGADLRILICHESDIHLDGADDEAINKIIARFPELDFRTAEQWKAAHRNEPSTHS